MKWPCDSAMVEAWHDANGACSKMNSDFTTVTDVDEELSGVAAHTDIAKAEMLANLRKCSTCTGMKTDFVVIDCRVRLPWLFQVVTIEVSSVGKNCGGRRALVSCSKAKAMDRSFGSLQARPKKDMPTGKPNTNPAGTVMLG